MPSDRTLARLPHARATSTSQPKAITHVRVREGEQYPGSGGLSFGVLGIGEGCSKQNGDGKLFSNPNCPGRFAGTVGCTVPYRTFADVKMAWQDMLLRGGPRKSAGHDPT